MPHSEAGPVISLRIDLPNGARIGPGKVALLRSVRNLTSIAAAAREHGMSYRRAWLLIDDMNRCYTAAVVETFPGRSQAAGAKLTPFGERLVTLYEQAETRARAAVASQCDELVNCLQPDYRPDRGPAASRQKPSGAGA